MTQLNLKRVTFTGPDDATSISDLLTISQQYPWVEWGILVGEVTWREGGRPRYPSQQWFIDLQNTQAHVGGMQLSLHLQGYWVRRLLLGEWSIPRQLVDFFERVQLNFHAERAQCNPSRFAEALKWLDVQQIIMQLDGVNGNRYLTYAYEHQAANVYGLFDVSGGAGILPTAWPGPIYREQPIAAYKENAEDQPWRFHGYAGGLGPHNILTEIEKIRIAADGAPIWIDMETHIRSQDDKVFDLDKVRSVIHQIEPLMSKE